MLLFVSVDIQRVYVIIPNVFLFLFPPVYFFLHLNTTAWGLGNYSNRGFSFEWRKYESRKTEHEISLWSSYETSAYVLCVYIAETEKKYVWANVTPEIPRGRINPTVIAK